MATIAESSEGNPNPSQSSQGDYSPEKSKTFGDLQAVPGFDYAFQQAELAKKTIENYLQNGISIARARLDRVRITSSAHLGQTLDSLQEVKSDYHAYEDIAFGKIKEGIIFAAAQPAITTGAVLGLGFLALKKPRRFLYYSIMRLFVTEEALLSRAEAKVKGLQQSIDLLKTESLKLEKMAQQAEDEMVRGRTKLRQAGKQIQSVIGSAYKIERQAAGLKDVLKELPRREASRFRSQVSNLASEARRERNVLTKEVSKISNYGISV